MTFERREKWECVLVNAKAGSNGNSDDRKKKITEGGPLKKLRRMGLLSFIAHRYNPWAAGDPGLR